MAARLARQACTDWQKTCRRVIETMVLAGCLPRATVQFSTDPAYFPISRQPMDAIARDLMGFAASHLQKPIPDLPIIQIEPDCEGLGRIEWGLRTRIKLKYWRDGNAFDRSVFVHEAVHHIQHLNDMDKSEVEAITVQCLYLKSQGIDPRTELSFEQVLGMTGDKEFAKLEWL